MQSDLAKTLAELCLWHVTGGHEGSIVSDESLRDIATLLRTGKLVVVDDAQAALTAARAQVEGEIVNTLNEQAKGYVAEYEANSDPLSKEAQLCLARAGALWNAIDALASTEHRKESP